MLDRLEELEKKYIELSDKINDPDIISDNELWRRLMKEHSDITPIIEKYKEYKQTLNDIEDAKEMLNDSSLDEDFRQLAK